MSLYFKLRGILSKVYDEKIINDTFKKRTFVVEDSTNNFNGRGSDYYFFDLTGDNTSLIESFTVGDFIEVFFNVRCKEYKKEGMEDRVFVTLQAWRITKPRVGNSETQTSENNIEDLGVSKDVINSEGGVDEEDDLSF